MLIPSTSLSLTTLSMCLSSSFTVSEAVFWAASEVVNVRDVRAAAIRDAGVAIAAVLLALMVRVRKDIVIDVCYIMWLMRSFEDPSSFSSMVLWWIDFERREAKNGLQRRENGEEELYL